MTVYDPTIGTDPVQTPTQVDSLKLTLTDHPLILSSGQVSDRPETLDRKVSKGSGDLSVRGAAGSGDPRRAQEDHARIGPFPRLGARLGCPSRATAPRTDACWAQVSRPRPVGDRRSPKTRDLTVNPGVRVGRPEHSRGQPRSASIRSLSAERGSPLLTAPAKPSNRCRAASHSLSVNWGLGLGRRHAPRWASAVSAVSLDARMPSPTPNRRQSSAATQSTAPSPEAAAARPTAS